MSVLTQKLEERDRSYTRVWDVGGWLEEVGIRSGESEKRGKDILGEKNV